MADRTGAEQDLRQRLSVAALALIGVICLGVAGYTFLSPDAPLLDRVYMTVVTLTTVGYGEVIPTDTPALRIFTIFLMLFGMGILLFAVTTLTATLVELDLADIFRRRRMEKRIAGLQHHFIVCGAGDTGMHIIDELRATHTPYVVVEADPQRCDVLTAQDPDLLVLVGDATDDVHLETAGIRRARGIAAVLPNDKDNLYLTLTARGLNERLRIVARGVSDLIVAKLHKAGANAVVSPTAIGGLRIASELLRPHTVSFLDQMLRDSQASHRFGELPVAPGSAWAGKRVRDLALTEKRLLVVAVREPTGVFSYVPPAEHVLAPGSTLIVLGRTDTVATTRGTLLDGSASAS